jgi:hypothetical protein
MLTGAASEGEVTTADLRVAGVIGAAGVAVTAGISKLYRKHEKH